MVPEGWILLDTPEALDKFRRDHYLHVYTTALELAGTPAEAHRLASQVFLSVARRYANKALAQNCELYLAAQVNLLFAQQGASSPKAPARPTPEGSSPAPSEGQAAQRAQADSLFAKASQPNVPESELPPPTENAAPAVAAPLFPNSPAAPAQAMPPVAAPAASPVPPVMYTAPEAIAPQTFSAVPSAPAASVAPPAPAAMVAYAPAGATPAMPNAIPAQAMVTILVSAAPNISMPVGAQPYVYAAPAPTPAYAAPAQPTPLAPPTAATATASAVASASGATDALYNPADTALWSPDSEAKVTLHKPAEPSPAESEGYAPWEDEPEDKPSMFLSLVNGLLTLGSLAAFGYLLYRLNLMLKLF